MTNRTFTVDTQLFRELGELLVGEDATALTELVKNAYDADAQTVSVDGSRLTDREQGAITVVDDGIGMTLSQFRVGFLTIGGRGKTAGARRSKVFGRSFTGEKGVGRLAARKLARSMEIETWPWSGRRDDEGRLIAGKRGVRAVIDWDVVDGCKTLDEIKESGAVTVTIMSSKTRRFSGTTLRLVGLRHGWTKTTKDRFQRQATGFRPPAVFDRPLPADFGSRLIFYRVFRSAQLEEQTGDFRLGAHRAVRRERSVGGVPGAGGLLGAGNGLRSRSSSNDLRNGAGKEFRGTIPRGASENDPSSSPGRTQAGAIPRPNLQHA